VKVRRSLGEKRKEISTEQIAEITRLYHDHTEGDRVKIFPNESFGFLRISVERPLRVHYEVNDDTLASVEADKTFAALDGNDRATVINAIGRWRGERWDHGSKDLPKRLTDALARVHRNDHKLNKALLDALMVRDPDDPIVTMRGGAPEPDADLRDQENVPLPSLRVIYEADVASRLDTPAYRQAIDSYLAAEVLPYAPDAWVDHTKTKIGYEIPLTRHFYEYEHPRPLVEIDAEIKQLEDEIQDLLREVTE
jgi:type I restriction enzyme M protein